LLGLVLLVPGVFVVHQLFLRARPCLAEEVVEDTFQTASPPRVVVEMFNGGITVTTGVRSEVQARITKRGYGPTPEEAEEDLDNIDLAMTQENETIRIVARRRQQGSLFPHSSAAAELVVPEGAVLDVRTSNGGVTVQGPTGDVKAQASNGRIQIRESRGLLHTTTSNGGIEIESDHATVAARTSNGAIRFAGKLRANGKHSFRSSNGSLTLRLDPEAQFTLDAKTSNGRVRTDFPVKTTGKTQRTQLRGTVGAHPTATLELQTSNGGITIERY
jgi:DUF4097 and DUF4098 domain-containing protein YvlB